MHIFFLKIKTLFTDFHFSNSILKQFIWHIFQSLQRLLPFYQEPWSNFEDPQSAFEVGEHSSLIHSNQCKLLHSSFSISIILRSAFLSLSFFLRRGYWPQFYYRVPQLTSESRFFIDSVHSSFQLPPNPSA